MRSRIWFFNPVPGDLNLNQQSSAALHRYIQLAIQNQQRIIIFLDFDNTMIFTDKASSDVINPDEILNFSLIYFLGDLFKQCGAEHFDLRVLSARLSDKKCCEKG